MSRNRPGIKGYFIDHVEFGKRMLLVGAKDETDPTKRYEGPQAKVTWDEDWIYIVTDPYESHVMLNIEAVEPLRKALAKIALETKKSLALRQGDR